MKRIHGSIIFPVLLSAAWGVIVFIVYGFFSRVIPYGLYYPLILAGAAGASAMFRGIPLVRASFAGFAAGFVYTLLSFFFPLLGAFLSGACLGGGVAHGGKSGILVQALKGAVIFPFFVAGGVFIGSLGLYSGPFLSALFWASWLGLAVALITMPILKRSPAFGRNDLNDRIRDFTAEARVIESDIRELYETIR